MDHIDMSGSVFMGPFVGKQVVTPRKDSNMDSNYYVILRHQWYKGEPATWTSTVGVASTEEKAWEFILNWKDRDDEWVERVVNAEDKIRAFDDIYNAEAMTLSIAKTNAV